MAKFVNSSEIAILNRRAAAAGLSLSAIEKALCAVSEQQIKVEHLLPRNPEKDWVGEYGGEDYAREVISSYVNGKDCKAVLGGKRVTDAKTLRWKKGEVLILVSHNGDYSNTYQFDGAVWRHQGEEDHFWSAQCSNHLHHEGYYLFQGVRAKVAAALEVECDNSFHWAFDQVVGGQ